MNTVEIICTVAVAVITVLSGVLAGVWFIVRKSQKMAIDGYRLASVEKETSTIRTGMPDMKAEIQDLKKDMEGVKKDVASVNTRLGNMEHHVFELREDMSAVKTVLVQKFPNVINIMAMKKSPRRLNETGEWVFRQVNGDKFLSDNKEFLFGKIDSMKPKTAFDVEQAANFACAGYTDNDMFNDIKLYVYNAPAIKIKDADGKERDYEVTLGDVCYTLSLPLRDMYLKEHPEIPQ